MPARLILPLLQMSQGKYSEIHVVFVTPLSYRPFRRLLTKPAMNPRPETSKTTVAGSGISGALLAPNGYRRRQTGRVVLTTAYNNDGTIGGIA